VAGSSFVLSSNDGLETLHSSSVELISAGGYEDIPLQRTYCRFGACSFSLTFVWKNDCHNIVFSLVCHNCTSSRTTGKFDPEPSFVILILWND
jgi:hypothetical protein